MTCLTCGEPSRYFYPRSPCGERHFTALSITDTEGFLSTLSLRRATVPTAQGSRANAFLSTLSLRRATGDSVLRIFTNDISIHALLAESDMRRKQLTRMPQAFLSTLSLRRATDEGLHGRRVVTTFLSTLSLRRATPELLQ